MVPLNTDVTLRVKEIGAKGDGSASQPEDVEIEVVPDMALAPRELRRVCTLNSATVIRAAHL